MTIVIGDTGAVSFLNARFNDVWPAGGKNLIARLYVNDKTPGDGDITANYTEASGGGYTAKTLNNGSWTVSIVGGVAQATYATQVWDFTGALDGNTSVYGYYVTDADGIFQWADRFPTVCTPVAPGNHVDVAITFKASNGTPA